MISPKICHCIHYRNMSKYVTVSTTNTWDTKYVTVSNTWARKDTVTSYCTKYPLCIGSGVGDLLNMVDVYATIKWQEKRKRRTGAAERQKKHNREDKSKSCKKWEALQPHWPSRNIKRNKGSPFLKCVVSKWALPERGGCVKGLPVWFGALFSHVWLGV